MSMPPNFKLREGKAEDTEENIRKYMTSMREVFGDEDLHVNVHDARGQVGLYNFLISTI